MLLADIKLLTHLSSMHFIMTNQGTRIVVLVLLSFKLCYGLQVKQNYERNARICKEQSKHPYFDLEEILGKPWRIYYTWNIDMETKCLDMIVKNSTTQIVNRIYADMHDYLQMQPEWAAATLYISMGPSKHELLMFADHGAEGNFLAVPNVIKNANITPLRNVVPLLKFFIKLVNRKFLLMMDCQIGAASLMSRERPPYRSEVERAAKSLNLGEGLHACIAERRNDEQFGQ